MRFLRAMVYFGIGILLGSGLAVLAQAKPAEEIYQEVGPQVVKVYTGDGVGTGYALKTYDGSVVIMTNLHICMGSLDGQHLSFETQSEKLYNTIILKQSKTSDICALDALDMFEGIDMAELVNLSGMVHVLGHPKGFPLKYSIGFLLGRETIDIPYGEEIRWVDSYKSSALVLPGNSGSPVVDSEGDLVAMVYALEGDGNSWMIPLDKIKEFLNEL